MGDVTAIFDKVKDVLLVDKVIGKLTGYLELIPDSVKDFYYGHRDVCLIVAICAMVLIAFEGYKLFKMAMYVISASGFAIVGHMYLAPIVAPHLGGLGLPEYINVNALIAIALALIAVFLTRFAFNFMIMVLGGACGYLLGSVYVWRVLRDNFTTLEFLKNDMTKYIVGGVFAAIFVILFILLFKHVFIVGSSIGCLAFAGLLLQKLIAPGASKEIMFCFIIVCAVLGILAAVYQYKEEENSIGY
jgi:hypothetical protein